MLWILPIALFAQSTTGADDDPWSEFASADDFVAYINTSTARVLPDGTLGVWIEFRRTKPEKNGTVRQLALNGFNCQNVTVTTQAITWYDSAGKVTFSHTYASYERTAEAIPPGSIIEAAYQIVCNKR